MGVAEYSNYLYGKMLDADRERSMTRKIVFSVLASQNPKQSGRILQALKQEMPLISDSIVSTKPNLTKEEYLAKIPFLKKVMNAKPKPNRSIAKA